MDLGRRGAERRLEADSQWSSMPQGSVAACTTSPWPRWGEGMVEVGRKGPRVNGNLHGQRNEVSET